MDLSGENEIRRSSESTQADNVSQISADSEPLPEFIDVIKEGHIWEAGAAMFAEYCDFSTVHGVRYLGERKRSWKEKIFWIIVFLISIYMCFRLISELWTKWITMPVIISFSDKSTQICNIPFPTFTVCPDIKSNATLFRFAEFEDVARDNNTHTDEWTEQEKRFMDISLQVCDYTKTNDFKFTKSKYYGNFVRDLMELAPNVETIFNNVTFNDREESWDIYLDPVVTEMGLCYSFNMMPLDIIYKADSVAKDILLPLKKKQTTKWTLQKEFEENIKKTANTFPHRSFNSFISSGFIAGIMGKISDIDPVCSEGDEGFKFAVSTPGDIPQLSKQFFSIPFNYEVLIDITPELVTTSSSAADFAPEFRSCYYEHEKYLRFFTFYSQQNCELECLANYTAQKCSCVRFNMPRAPYTKICGAANIECYLNAKRELRENEARRVLENSADISIPKCDCLPSCTSLTYGVSVSQAPLDPKESEEKGYKMTNFYVYFKENRFWSLERSKLYDVIEFTADAGGLLGLFMGISLLSFVEFFYFFSVRLCGNIHLRYCSNIRNRVIKLQRRLSSRKEKKDDKTAEPAEVEDFI